MGTATNKVAYLNRRGEASINKDVASDLRARARGRGHTNDALVVHEQGELGTVMTNFGLIAKNLNKLSCEYHPNSRRTDGVRLLRVNFA